MDQGTMKTLTYYNEKTDAFVFGTQAVDFHDTQDLFLSFLPQGSSILDFGCGSGRDTRYFLEKGYHVVATDGSEELCKVASAYTGVQARKLLFQELQDENCYDGIWACSSILHAGRTEQPDIFRRMILALKEQGYIYTSFKYSSNDKLIAAYSQRVCYVARHCHNFTPLFGCAACGYERSA